MIKPASLCILCCVSLRCYVFLHIQLQPFDSMGAPILLYASEVSGFEKSDVLESLYLQFYKINYP